MDKILQLVVALAVTTVMLSFTVMNSYVAAQNSSQGIQTGEHQGIPGSQENANPLTQAPISGLEVKPPNNSSNVPPIEKGNLTGTSQ
jgi:hypothetical protein